MQKLVTSGSLRLGLELSGEENCIELRPILSDCRMRDREILAKNVTKSLKKIKIGIPLWYKLVVLPLDTHITIISYIF